MDDNNNRAQWVATYPEANRTNEGPLDSPTVDDNNNRAQRVATYPEANRTNVNDGSLNSPTVDDNNNRAQWVATYPEANRTANSDSGSTVDYTSRKGEWVFKDKASLGSDATDMGVYDHWVRHNQDLERKS